MISFETTDAREARRFRIAQFNGRTTTIRAAGLPVTGRVRSVQEDRTSVPSRWTVTIVPIPPKERVTPQRAPPRMHALAEDFY